MEQRDVDVAGEYDGRLACDAARVGELREVVVSHVPDEQVELEHGRAAHTIHTDSNTHTHV